MKTQLLGWTIFFCSVVLAAGIPSILIVARIRLRAANALARKYASEVCPRDATNVKVHFRLRLFKLATLGWITGGNAEFSPLVGPRHIRTTLWRHIGEYVYMRSMDFGRSDFTGRSWGRLLHVETGGEDAGIGTIEQYLGKDVGYAPTYFSADNISVFVTFESYTLPEEWAA